ncbi:MAG: aldo/keto reductase [Propionibacteriaceae bacterium]|nr:aldo/keto reductase [Propionibacteriaceae bacterium]
MMGVLQEHFTLDNGVLIPKVGFGTWQTPDDVAPQAVLTALRVGYTHIDTARAYQNEAGVGKGIRAAGATREEVFVTTKVPAQMKTYAEAKESIETSLAQLQMSQVDLLLIHAPRPWQEMFTPGAPRYFDENAAVWKALEEAYQDGRARAIGVSNFQIDDIENITSRCDIAPLADQIRFHIGHTQEELVEFCQASGILVEAYSPIATGKLLDDPSIAVVASRLGKSVAQVCIRYALQKGTLPLPKSVHEQFIIEDAHVDFEISPDDMAALDSIQDVDD